MTNKQWHKASETLPINDENDPKFDGSWFDCDVLVKTKSGTEQCQFYACWEYELGLDAPSIFLADFDCKLDVLEWRYL